VQRPLHVKFEREPPALHRRIVVGDVQIPTAVGPDTQPFEIQYQQAGSTHTAQGRPVSWLTMMQYDEVPASE